MNGIRTRGKNSMPHRDSTDPPRRREVHCNSCEGAGAAPRTSLRAFRGVHKQYLHRYVAMYEAMVNTKQVTSQLIRRMCVGALVAVAGRMMCMPGSHE